MGLSSSGAARGDLFFRGSRSLGRFFTESFLGLQRHLPVTFIA
jgi:hypothetical protein